MCSASASAPGASRLSVGQLLCELLDLSLGADG